MHEPHLAAARAGDRAAFGELYVAHHHAVARKLVRLVGPGPSIDDLVQETFVRAFSALRSFRGDCPFRAWLLRIATRVARSAHRGVQRSLFRLFTGDDEERALGPVTTDASPDVPRVRRALQELSPKLREAVVMYELEGRTHAEIARTLGVPLHTVAARVRRGRAALRERVLRGATRIAAVIVAVLLVVSAARAWRRGAAVVHPVAPPALHPVAPPALRSAVPSVLRSAVPSVAVKAAKPARHKKAARRAPVPELDEPLGDVIEVARPAALDPLFTVEDYRANGH